MTEHSSIFDLISNPIFFGRIESVCDVNLKNYEPLIVQICKINDCAVNNGLLEIKKFIQVESISPFLKKMIYLSTSEESNFTPREIFNVFSTYLILSDLRNENLIRSLLMLQGYMYILEGTTTKILYEKLSICLGNF